MKGALTIILTLALASCASPRRGAAPRPEQSRADDGHRYEKAPLAGMTRTQAWARYGKPRKRVQTEEGERWYYILNASEVARKTLNPLVLAPPHYRTGILVFGANDKLKRFAWEAKN